MTFTGPERLIAKPGVPAHQAGGTFVGFLLGMLFGLAVALGVAVYITKVPLPFMNKNQTRPADDAAAAKKIKEWDPNAGMPGRVTKHEGTAVQAAPESAPVAPAASSVPTLPSATPAPQTAAPAAPAAPAQAKTTDPLGDLARARIEPTSPTPPTNPLANPVPPSSVPPAAAGGEPFQYFVQAGAYRSADDAEQQRAKLSLMGLQSKLSERDQAGRLVYRVRLGPFDKREEADKARERLAGNGIEAVVVRLQR
jgi:cell division protein FtsN